MKNKSLPETEQVTNKQHLSKKLKTAAKYFVLLVSGLAIFLLIRMAAESMSPQNTTNEVPVVKTEGTRLKPQKSNPPATEKPEIIASQITSTFPFTVIYIEKTGNSLKLYRTVNGEEKFSLALPSMESFFGEDWNTDSLNGFSFEIPYQWNKGTILFKTIISGGGMDSGEQITGYQISEAKSLLSKIYTLTISYGGEQISPEPTALTFGNNELLYNCKSTYFISSTQLALNECDGKFLLYEQFATRQEDLKGKTPYEYNYFENKSYIYYDSNGEKMAPKILKTQHDRQIILDIDGISYGLIMGNFDGQHTNRFIEAY